MSKINFKIIAKKVLKTECNGILSIEKYINKNFNQACELIFKCIGKLVIIGIGKSGHIGRKIASTLASTGTESFFIHATEANHGDLGMINKKDIVLAISNSGESKEILTLIPILKEKKIRLICMTRNSNSSMGKLADIHICIKIPKEACPFDLVPTTSTTAMLVMGDAIAISLLNARGFTKKDFILSHPGGILGKNPSKNLKLIRNKK